MGELRSCPFCGAKAKRYTDTGDWGYTPSRAGVRCGSGKCHVRPSVAFADTQYDPDKRRTVKVNARQRADEAWNTRHGD